TAALFGLLALAHALTIFIFLGVLVFVGIYFRPPGIGIFKGLLGLGMFGTSSAMYRRRAFAQTMMVGIFLLFYAPWMVRNYQVCGSPVGLGWYSALYQIRG